ncbi:ribonuclease H-like domain-containing protein [Tanacetum coccineum]
MVNKSAEGIVGECCAVIMNLLPAEEKTEQEVMEEQGIQEKLRGHFSSNMMRTFLVQAQKQWIQTLDRSLPSEWKTHALIWRNKKEIETISLDDLYNNLKIYEPKLTESSSTSQNLQNVSFVSSNSTNSNSSTNEVDNTAYEVSAAHTQKAPRNQENRGRENNRRTVTVETPTGKCLGCSRWNWRYDWRYHDEEVKRYYPLVSTLTTNTTQLAIVSALECSSHALQLRTQVLSLFPENPQTCYSVLSIAPLLPRLKIIAPGLERFVNSFVILENQEYNKSKSDKGYHAVPPPYTGNFIPFKPDLTFMDEIVKSKNMDVITIVTPSNGKKVESNHESADVKNNGDAVEPKTVRKNSFRPPVIEDWNSDDDSEVEFIPNVEDKTVRPSTEKIKFVKSARETVEKVETPKQNKHYPRGNQRNWNNLMSQRLGSDFKMINKACFICGSFEHLHNVCDKKVIRPVWNNSSRVNHKNFANKMTHPHPNRRFVPQAVLTKSGKINTAGASVNTVVRPVNTAGSKTTVNHPRPISNAYKKGYSQVTRPFNKYSANKNSIFNKKVNIVRATHSRRSTRKRQLLEWLLKAMTGRQMLSYLSLTRLFAKATIDESSLWHWRLGHINFKNMNKLMRGKLVRGLPSKIFENDHSCVACQKGKQHKASCKAKLVNSISKPLHMLHMDLFGPTNVKSLMKKIENQLDHESKELSNVIMELSSKISGNESVYEMKGIKREFNVARTPQQNGVAERKNRTLMRIARTFVAENQTNGIAGTRDNIVGGQAEKKKEPEQEYILIPFYTTNPLISQDPKVSEEDAEEKPTKMDEGGASDKDRKDKQATRSEFERLLQQEQQIENPNSTNSINTVSTPVSTARPSCTDDDPSSPVNAAEASNAFEEHRFEQFSPFKNAFTLLPVLNVTPMDDTGIFGNAYDDEDVGVEADLNNLETTMNVSPIPTTRIDKDHPKDQIIGDFNLAIQTRRMTKITDEHAMVSYINMQRRTNHKDYQNCLLTFCCTFYKVYTAGLT